MLFRSCRTRWRCATLAATRQAKHGLAVSAATVRRWLHERGGVWKRAKRVAKEADPHRVERLARIRFQPAHWPAHAVMVFVAERDLHRLPQGGAAWMPQGTQAEVMTPGKHEKPSLAGALPRATGKGLYCLGPRKNTGWFRELWPLLDTTSPARQISRLYVVADKYCMHKAKAVAQWLARHPRFEVLWVPTYCPRAHPIERVFGDVPDKGTRKHKRQRLRALVQDVEWHGQAHGPWPYTLSHLYDAPEIMAAVENIAAEKKPRIAA